MGEAFNQFVRGCRYNISILGEFPSFRRKLLQTEWLAGGNPVETLLKRGC